MNNNFLKCGINFISYEIIGKMTIDDMYNKHALFIFSKKLENKNQLFYEYKIKFYKNKMIENSKFILKQKLEEKLQTKNKIEKRSKI